MSQLKQYRRSALKLIARARMRGKQAEPLLRGLASIAAVAAAGAVVWAVLGFARVGFAEVESVSQPAQPVANAEHSGEAASNARGGTLARRECLVYVTEGDAAHYHASVHTASESERKAISLDLARSKGLEACRTCFRGKGDGAKAVVSTGASGANR